MLWGYYSKRKTNVNNFIEIFQRNRRICIRGYLKIENKKD